jgi:glycerol kinase
VSVRDGGAAGPEALILAVDQGTSSTRAIAFTRELEAVASATRPLTVTHSRPGWAEENATEILATVVDTVADVVATCGGIDRFGAAGLANQGETVIAWDADSGSELVPAVLWHDDRSTPIVERLRSAGHEPAVRERTGLPLDPYYSAGKMKWLLENVPAIRSARAAGRLRLGTVDAWLTERLGGESLTDPSTASRTQLYDLASQTWSPDLLELFDVAPSVLPRIVATAGPLGELRDDRWGGALPLRALACDQQAALAGQGGFAVGATKATYGTGIFVVANAGETRADAEGIETSVAWSLPGQPLVFILQGGVLSAGSFLGWLTDGLGILEDSAESDRLATSVEDSASVRVLPALGALGAPWWHSGTGGVIAGLSGAADRRHVARATLDGLAQRVCDVIDAMAPALDVGLSRLRVDGGLSANRYLMQRQADLLGIPVEVAATSEATSRGVAALAGLGAGLLAADDVAAGAPVLETFVPRLDDRTRKGERSDWRRFVDRATAVGPL